MSSLTIRIPKLRSADLRPSKIVVLLVCFSGVLFLASEANAQKVMTKKGNDFETITFASKDGLTITADLYLANKDHKTPMIVLCHQAGWSRGEYREIAPKLNKMGFNCMAIDQRSGGAVNGVVNQSNRAAAKAKKGTKFLDARQDMEAALLYAKKNHAKGKLILWGSSYSSALALVVAGDQPGICDGVLAFAPGEYFKRFGKPGDWVGASAKKIKVPAFITSAKHEFTNWKAIFEAIPSKTKVKFVPETSGNHGSRALWNKFDDSKAYWKAVTVFLQQFKSE